MNIENCLHSMILYNEYTKLCTFFESFHIDCTNLTLLIMYVKKMFTYKKIEYVEYIESYTLF